MASASSRPVAPPKHLTSYTRTQRTHPNSYVHVHVHEWGPRATKPSPLGYFPLSLHPNGLGADTSICIISKRRHQTALSSSRHSQRQHRRHLSVNGLIINRPKDSVATRSSIEGQSAPTDTAPPFGLSGVASTVACQAEQLVYQGPIDSVGPNPDRARETHRESAERQPVQGQDQSVLARESERTLQHCSCTASTGLRAPGSNPIS